MSVFPNTHPERLAPGSFQQPVPIPASLPGDSPLVQVCFNRDWLPYLLGCLFQLTLATTWQANSPDELAQILGEANNLILIFQQATAGCSTANLGSAGADGDDFMLRQNPDNPCELQSSVDGVTWCTWADLSKCTGQPLQPGSTTKNPGAGGCQTVFGTCIFGSKFLLPFPVSTGDQITVSNAVGSWAGVLDLGIPRCPDGNIFFNVSGISELDACVDGTGHTESGDPAPTINHDSLIGFDGTNYYDFGGASTPTPVVITIPSGISNANFYLFANTTDTVGFGSVQFDIKYCNNATPGWTETFDFTANPFGWTSSIQSGGTGTPAVWTPGVGWQARDSSSPIGDWFRRLVLNRTIAPTTITSMQMFFNEVAGPNEGTGAAHIVMASFNGGENDFYRDTLADQTTGDNQQRSGSGNFSSQTSLFIDGTCSTASSSGGLGGSFTLFKLIVSGTGINPFTGP